MRSRYVVLLVLIALVVGGWTAAWFYVRDRVITELDTALQALAAEGVDVVCADRSTGGWPFRLEVTCLRPDIRLPDGSRAEAAALAATGHVMDPRLVVAEFEAPLRLTAPDGSGALAGFTSLRASLRVADDRLERVSAEASDLTVEAGPAGFTLGRLSANRGEVHYRPAEGTEGDAELVVTLAGATGSYGSNSILPAPSDAGLDAVVTDVALLDGTAEGLAAWAQAGGRLDLRQAVLSVGDTRLSATGSGTVSSGGAVEATLEATASGIGWLTEQVKAGRPVPAALTTLASAFLLIGKPVEGADGARRVVIDVANGAVKANGLPVASVPPAF